MTISLSIFLNVGGRLLSATALYNAARVCHTLSHYDMEQLSAPYTNEELRDKTKAQLTDLIKRQPEKWPRRERFNPSKVSKPDMVGLLVDPDNGYFHDPDPDPNDPGAEQGDVRDVSSQHVNAMDALQGGDGDDEFLSILLEDVRVHPPLKSCVRLRLTSDTIIHAGHARQISASKVITTIQRSNSAIKGHVRLSSPSRADPSYREYFVNGVLTGCSPEPEALAIDSEMRVWIRVEDSSNTTQLPQPSSPYPPTTIIGTIDEVTQWLRATISQEPDFKTFEDSQHRAVHNVVVAQIWMFVSCVHDRFYRTICPHKITKKTIYTALGVGETWLAQALDGARLIKKYGPGGPHAAEEVKSLLSDDSDKDPCGRRELLKFLQDWERGHSVDSI